MKCPFAEWHPSPNHSKRRATVSLIVLHQTDGQPDLDRSVESHCKAENVKSAHFFVGREGRIVQLVDTDDAAWHDKGRNHESIGIEHVARTPGEFRNWSELHPSLRKKLLADGTADGPTDPGMQLTSEQLAASARLVAWLLREYNLSTDAVVPHCSNSDTSHKDCGRDVSDGGIWNWAAYRSLLNEEMAKLSG